MDPLTQGLLGAALPQATLKQESKARIAGALGFLSGLAADLDVLIGSDRDPLLFLEYHRHFTHSLFFIPWGAAFCAMVLHPFFRKHLRFWENYLYCLLGYSTHALLDACTTYGTQLLWPLSNERFSWHLISIIDPLFTLPLLALVLLSFFKRKRIFTAIGLAYALFYLALGAFQRERVETRARGLSLSRGHVPTHLEAHPSFGNILLWKTLYSTKTHFHVDAIRALGEFTIYEGDSIPILDLERDFPWLPPGSQQARDVERFRWFSSGFVAKLSEQENLIGDIRFSTLPNEIRPLWGIALDPKNPESHARCITMREIPKATRARFWQMLFE